MTFFTEIGKNNPKFQMEAQKTLNSQHSSKNKEECWRYHVTGFQVILQSHSNKTSMVLAQSTDAQTNAIEQRTHK
jgi:hypothetical protein